MSLTATSDLEKGMACTRVSQQLWVSSYELAWLEAKKVTWLAAYDFMVASSNGEEKTLQPRGDAWKKTTEFAFEQGKKNAKRTVRA